MGLASFLKPMLTYYPHKRMTAQQALRHYWLKMPARADFKLTEIEIKKKELLQGRTMDAGYASLGDPETENIESDKEDNNSQTSDFPSEEHDNYGYDDVMNNSFGKTGYIPYGGGINVADLDQDPNWQFVDADEVEAQENKK